ncbi:PilW family protein [Endozoicomonas sp. GU-1]|uniref:PilW family protein n=2 Tax=Endozoicomonas sp. GU-1 TaxID=3009078 RepID=UPI0022B3FBD4|nr:PilW family protein [Endozoicomonas sp. GU-1]WBA79421.1 PilW family protein [Endozoicomonas sp. GU-1]
MDVSKVMIKNPRAIASDKRQQGFTLVELMVAVTLSLFLLAGVAVLYLNTFTAQRDSSAMITLNDNARTALAIISRDLRSAGYINGLPPESINQNGLAVSDDCTGIAAALTPSPAFMAGRASNDIFGCAAGQPGDYTANDGLPSDWLLFRGAIGEVVTNPVADTNYLVANTQEGHLFRSANAPLISADQEIREYQFSLFYLRDNQLRLTRLVNDALVETTLANNIEAMRVFLGIDDNGDGQVNRYQGTPANTNNWTEQQWNDVQSIKLYLLATTDQINGFEDFRTYQMGDITVQPNGDNRNRRLASTTIFLYNQTYR